MSRNAFLSLRSEKNIFFDFDIVVKTQIECGLALSVLLSTTITVVKSCCGLTQLHFVSPQHLTTVMTRIIVDKSTDHAKPHVIC